MSLLNKTAKRTKSNAKSLGKTAKRVLATTSATFMLFGLAACGPKENVEVKPEEQTNSQQAQFNELQEQMKQLQNELNGLKQDVSKLKENDAALLQLITSNMTIVSNLISDLQAQISNISSQSSTNEQAIESLKQSQTAISTQLSTLQTNMQSFATELETLKSQTTDKADSKLIKDLQNSIASTQSIINKLITQNAINTTFTTDYNDIYVDDISKGSGHCYTAPNGDFVTSGSREGLTTQSAVYENGLYFFKDYNGAEEVRTSDVVSMQNVLYESFKDTTNVVADDNVYTFQQGKGKTITFYLSNDGKITKIADNYGNETYNYLFNKITKKDYDSERSYVTSQISTYGYYQDLSSAVDKSFDYRYGVLSATMSDTDGNKGNGKIVIGNDRLAEYSTVVGQNGTTNMVGIMENGSDKFIQQAINGEITESIGDPRNYQHLSMKYYANGIKDTVFNGTFKIEYNSKSDTYTVTSTDAEHDMKQVFSVALGDDGKFTAFNVEVTTPIGTQSLTYQLQGVNKAAFEKAFNEINEKYEELLALKNENGVNI